jgi:hypothetical protein
MSSLFDAITAAGAALGLLVVVIVGVALIQIVLQYTMPNIGYHVRSHRDRDYTFFVRNLDSVHYKQSLHLIVSGLGLKYVGALAGPWSQRQPMRLEDDMDGRVRVLIMLDEIPEDAAFAIRALCVGDVPRIEIADDSPLQARAFRKPLAKFTLAVKLRYYSLRYLIGIVGFVTIFIGGVRFNNQEINIEDWVLVVVAMIVAGLSFVLVVPYRGKTTIVGYLTSTEITQFWGDRTGTSGNLPRSE